MDKAGQVKPWEDTLAGLAAAARTPAHRRRVREFRILLEEFRVSTFAQELGTRQKASAKRLEALAAEIREAVRAA
jgi:ATP-dependent helicase HrpA